MMMMIMSIRVTSTIFISPEAYDCSVYIPWKSQPPTPLTSRLLRGLLQPESRTSSDALSPRLHHLPPPPCRFARISITTPTTSSSVSPFRQHSSSLSISTNLRFELLFDLSSVQPSSCIRDLDLVAVALAFVVSATHRAPTTWIYQRTRTRHLGPACVAPVASGRARCRPVWLLLLGLATWFIISTLDTDYGCTRISSSSCEWSEYFAS